jgi:hypothetical protein
MRRVSCLVIFALLAFASIAPANPIVRSRGQGHGPGQQIFRGLSYNAYNVGAAFALGGGCNAVPAASYMQFQQDVQPNCSTCNGVQAAPFVPQFAPQVGYGLGLQRGLLQRSAFGAYGLGAAFDPGIGYGGSAVILRQRGIVLRQRGIAHQRGIFRGGRQIVRQRTVLRR